MSWDNVDTPSVPIWNDGYIGSVWDMSETFWDSGGYWDRGIWSSLYTLSEVTWG